MVDMECVAGFSARYLSECGVAAEPRGAKRKPWRGRHHASTDEAALDQLPEARLDKNAVLGLLCARI